MGCGQLLDEIAPTNDVWTHEYFVGSVLKGPKGNGEIIVDMQEYLALSDEVRHVWRRWKLSRCKTAFVLSEA